MASPRIRTRLDADYLPFFASEEKDAREIIDNASAFTSGVSEWIRQAIETGKATQE